MTPLTTSRAYTVADRIGVALKIAAEHITVEKIEIIAKSALIFSVIYFRNEIKNIQEKNFEQLNSLEKSIKVVLGTIIVLSAAVAVTSLAAISLVFYHRYSYL